MKRLTDEDGICINCEGLAYCRLDCDNKKIYDKLKQYEDLGFTPEEIAYMAKLLNEHKEAYWIRHNWAEVHEGCLIPNYECSECGNWERDNSDYCPDCGCKMTEVR